MRNKEDSPTRHVKCCKVCCNMEEEWDADGFEPKVKIESKWADEDADDDVKDNWEDEDEEEEEKKDTEKQEESNSRNEEAQRQLTPEERLAEKLRQQMLQEEADLKVAVETFGISAESCMGGGLDAMNPSTKEEFEEFSKALVKKIIPFSSSQHFPFFAEELIRNMCVAMNSADMKKLKNTLDNLQLEKAKMEKGDKAKKNKGKGKAKLRIEGESAIVNEYSAYGDMDEYDDFM
ncbi:hypothetical protein B566_EDAN007985 [Ephemera danica]|nr:hypothetical protein B566_EDAN007985 [Ephemera danica]